MSKQPLISIIVPSYNVEEIYRECVDSILNQTYRNIEVILVNDGSTDHTGTIADEYVLLDSRVKVIHKENGGAASARNCGIDVATGDYYGFVDSDDWIEPDMYERLLKPFLANEIGEKSFSEVAYRNHNMDGSCDDYCVTENVKIIREDYLWDDFLDINGAGLIQQAIWNKLFPANLFEENRFREGVIGEDVEILYRLIDKVEMCMVLPYVGYHARQIETSVTHKPLSEVNFTIAEISNEKIEFIRERHPDKLILAYAYDLKQQTNIWQRLVYAKNEKEFKDKKKLIKKRIARDLRMVGKEKKVCFKEKAIGYLILFNLFKFARMVLVHK